MASEVETTDKPEIDEEVERLRALFNKQIYTKAEIKVHNTEEAPWVLIYDGVYDMSEFQMDHPGGPDVLTDVAGEDSTEEFENVLHTEKARKMGHKYLIGSIEGGDFDKWLKNMHPKKKKANEINNGESPNIVMYIVVILAIVAAFYFYNNQSEQK